MLRGLTLFVMLTCTACWSHSRSMTPASAGPGETGFGATAHTHTFYAVLAATVVRFQATGNVAMVDAAASELPTDSVWQSYDGGGKIRHCFVVQGGRHVCADAEGVDLAWGKSALFIDPINLGSFITEVHAGGRLGRQSFYGYGRAGSLYAGDDNRMRVAPGHGVWATITEGNTMHCQLEGATPRCREVSQSSEMSFGGRQDRPLGVFAHDRQNILWIALQDGVFRCIASPQQPEPQCSAARIQ